jgi:hypothetical protein
MTRSTSLLLVLAACFATACEGIDDGHADGDETHDDGQHPPPPPETPLLGTPCEYRHGTHTLTSWAGQDDASYAASSFSFEMASNELALTSNDVDLLHEGNMIRVNTVTDDRSFIVDLGDVALRDAPPEVDAADYPVGMWGEHDAIGAVLDHTYVVRTVDGNTRQWAAFKIVALSPGREMTIAWIRSPDPERLQIPTDCL